MFNCFNCRSISTAQTTLFVSISILAIAAIVFQLGKASFLLGLSTRKLIETLDGTGGPAGWLQFAYKHLSREVFLTHAGSLTTGKLAEKQLVVEVSPRIPGSHAVEKVVAVQVNNGLQKQRHWSVPLTDSLAVRKGPVFSDCCLLKSKSGKQLSGNALSAKIAKLQRLNVLVV